MTSKEIIDKMIEKYSWLGKEYCHLIENENPYKCNQQVFEEMANQVLKDLERLEILKKYLYYDNNNHFIKMKHIRKSIYNFDYEDLKEWLENE